MHSRVFRSLVGVLLLAAIASWWVFRNEVLTPRSPLAQPVSQAVPATVPRSNLSAPLAHTPALARHEGQSLADFFKDMGDYAVRHRQAAIPRLLEFLHDPDWQVRCAALRALALTGHPQAISLLASYLRDDIRIEESAQAALALAQMDLPGIADILQQGFHATRSPELREGLLQSLASLPAGDTEAFFLSYLQSSTAPPSEKAETLHALGFHKQAPLHWILSFLDSGDPILRAGAYRSLAARGDAFLGANLLPRVSKESDSTLRAELYSALGEQGDLSPAQLAQLATSESDPAARLRALKAWGRLTGRNPTAGEAARFSRSAIPVLVTTALENPDPGESRAALQALASARTAESRAALQDIAARAASPSLARLARNLAEGVKPTP